MPRESGASSNPRVIGRAPNRSHVVTGSPAFAGDDMYMNHLFSGGS